MCPSPACRLKRRMYSASARRLVKAILFIMYIIFFVMLISLLPVNPLVDSTVKNFPLKAISFCERDPLLILKKAMPVLEWSSFEDDGPKLTVSRAFWNIIEAFVRVDLHNTAAVLQSQIPLLTAVELTGEVAAARLGGSSGGGIVTEEKGVSPLSGESLVSIYNTHTGETYRLTDGVERLDGRRGGVVAVAAAIEETLENRYGIKVARSDKINDANYSTSYIESEKTARGLLAANPKTKVLLDIHRDSGKTRKQSVINVNGQEVAPVLLVVGSDARNPFPTWRQNYAFAVRLSEKINEMYPGLSLGVRVKEGRYNQHLHPRAVLVEVGTTNNYIEEALQSARLFASALAELFIEEQTTVPPEDNNEQ